MGGQPQGSAGSPGLQLHTNQHVGVSTAPEAIRRESGNYSPQLTWGQEQFFFPALSVENLIFHGVLGKIFRIVLCQ